MRCWRSHQSDLLRVSELFVDRRVLLYAMGLSLLTGRVVGARARRRGSRAHSMSRSIRHERIDESRIRHAFGRRSSSARSR